MRGEPIKHPRKVGRHIAAIMDFLAEHEATNVLVYKTRHVQIDFTIGKFRGTLHTACTPRDEHNAIRYALNDLRRLIEPALVNQLAGLA